MLDKFPIVPTNITDQVPGLGPILPTSGDLKRFLYMDQVYDPDRIEAAEAHKYYVPREGEVVFDENTNIFYKCTHVDYEGKTLKPTFIIVGGSSGSNNESDHDYDQDIFGINGGFQGEGIVGIDYSVRPNVANADRQLMCPGASYALLYNGSTLTDANIISAVYSSAGVLQTTMIDVSLASIDRLDNKSIMTTEPFSVRLNEEELPAGSRVTLVFFDSGNNMISRPRILNVMHTKVLATHQVGKRYIKDVTLVAPWFTDTNNPEVLAIPINTRLDNLVFSCLVHYSDGTPEPRVIDGKKIRLMGMKEHSPTAPNQGGWLTLNYNFDKDESAYEAQAGVENKFAKNYRIFVKPFEGAYSPKLFVVPVWGDKKFDLHFYLTDLDRQFAIDVTDKVYLNESSPAFRPTSYGVEQSLEFNLRLSDASKSFKPLIMRQPFTVLLRKAGTEKGSKWAVRYSYLGVTFEDPTYKAVLHEEGTRLTYAGLAKTQDEFIEMSFSNLEPAINPTRERKPPAPTHYELIDMTDQVWRFSVDTWNQELRLSKRLTDGTGFVVRWIKVNDDGTELILAVGGMSADY